MFHPSLLGSQYMPSSICSFHFVEIFFRLSKFQSASREELKGRVIIFTAKSLPGSFKSILLLHSYYID